MLFEFELEDGNFLKAGYAFGQIKKALKQLTIDPRIIKRVIVVFYEAGMNIVTHVWRGAIVAELDANKISLELKDEGPGTPDISPAMRERYSTASEAVREMGFGARVGLPDIKKSVDELTIESQVDVSTTVRMVTWSNKEGTQAVKEANSYHALKIDNNHCIDCTCCIKECPMGAACIQDGKVLICKDWYVDCGECLKSCLAEVIYVRQDDLQRIFDYKCGVALMSTVFIGQLSKYMTEKEIIGVITELGFTHVFQAEFTIDMTHKEIV